MLRPRAALACLLVAAVAQAAEPGSPTDVASRFYAALHRFDAEGAAALATGPEARRTLQAFVELSRAFARLEEALGKRFGAEAAQRVGYGAKSKAEALAFLAAHDEIEGEKARVVGADGRMLASLTRRDGRWRVELSEALNLAEGIPALERDASVARQAAGEVSERLASGRYAGAAEALTDFQARTRRAAEQSPRPGERAL